MPIISFISISSSIGTSEEELKVHFKEKHKINTVKPFLIKRICRICDYDKSTSNDQLVKHITDEHPRSDYGDEDEGNIYFILKLKYSEKATKFSEIFTLLLTTVHTVKSKVKTSQNFVAFSKDMNFNKRKGGGKHCTEQTHSKFCARLIV